MTSLRVRQILASAELVAVVDHHKIGDVTTNNPILFRAEPVGCTGTVLNKMFKEAGVAIPKDVAGGMLAAILSDTVNFKSPTCTEDDKLAVNDLKTVCRCNGYRRAFHGNAEGQIGC